MVLRLAGSTSQVPLYDMTLEARPPLDLHEAVPMQWRGIVAVLDPWPHQGTAVMLGQSGFLDAFTVTFGPDGFVLEPASMFPAALPARALSGEGAWAPRSSGRGVATDLSWVYRRYMTSTTVKLTVATRDRIRALGGDTYEATIIEALDVLEEARFWTQADAAAAWRHSLSDNDRERLAARDADVDAAFDGIE